MNDSSSIRGARYGTAVFLGAFLLFLVQPLLGNAILPWFGGASSVWTACLLFFQAVLVGGYAYAHALARLSPRVQAAVHAALLAASLAFLPILPAETWRPVGDQSPVLRILLLLTVTVGVPYLLLASTGPLLQSWLSRESGGAPPYRYYALSNAASLLGLVAYPFLLQPRLDLDNQAAVWSWGYGAFAAAAAACGLGFAWIARREPSRRHPDPGDETGGGPLDPRAVLLWGLLPAAASVLLVGITNALTADVAAVPFLWVLPLVLYLATFIVAFEREAWYSRRVMIPLFVAALLWNSVFVTAFVHPHWWLKIAGAGFSVFAGAMVCHGELARTKPHPRHLTAFYLTLAGGGAFGGFLVAVVAPLVFPGYWEVPLGLFGTLLVVLVAVARDPASGFPGKLPPVARNLVAGGVGLAGPALLAIPLMLYFNSDIQRRSFYGVLNVIDSGEGTPSAQRRLMHGSTLHGMQFRDEARRRLPTTYFGPGSGVSVAVGEHPKRERGEPMRIGVVGLGAGTIAAWGRAGDLMRFYEINRQVAELARDRFTFLADSPARIEIAVTDGRLGIERDVAAGRAGFDVLVVDAFSGGSIPTHLLTREAFALYRRALAPGGILAVHVSNKYLDLARVVRGGAASPGFEAIPVTQHPDHARGIEDNAWVLVTGDRDFLDRPDVTADGRGWDGSRPPVVWTDRQSSLLPVFR